MVRTLDAYVTCSLGLPRNLRALDTLEAPTDAPFVDNREMLLASNANVDLLEILGQAREKTYFTDAAAAGESPTVVNPKHLHELSGTLDRWAQKYPYFSHSISGDLDSCTK